MSFDNVGDDTIGFRITSDAEGISVTVDMVAWNEGQRVAIVMLSGLGATDPQPLTELAGTISSRI